MFVYWRVLDMTKAFPGNWHINHMGGRMCGRKQFNEILPTARCKTEDCAFTAPIRNISSNGVFIKSNRHFSVGQEVAMTITFPATGESHMVTGQIVRVTPEGIGINFKIFFRD
jgi:Tfp pilus assembly protein PilZ